MGSGKHSIQTYYCPAAWGTGPQDTASPSLSLFREETEVHRKGTMCLAACKGQLVAETFRCHASALFTPATKKHPPPYLVIYCHLMYHPKSEWLKQQIIL